MEKYDFDLEEIFMSIDMLDTLMSDFNGETENEEENSAETEYTVYSKQELEGIGFGEAQIEEITLGMEQRLPVQHYARITYNWKQMHEIRIGLLEHLDVGLYDNELYSAEQMYQIRRGLQQKLDVSVYANLICTARDMEKARKNLLTDAYMKNPRGYAKEITDEASGVSVRISDDCMQAFLTVPKDRKISARELERILKRNEITNGILKEQLKKAANGKAFSGEFLAANGQKAKMGKDGRYEYFFDTVRSRAPQIQPDGSVDYGQMIAADKKKPGDILAKYYPATSGKDGETVTGIKIKGKKGKNKEVLHGHGIIGDVKTKTYRADVSGYVEFDETEGKLNVWDIYVVNGDINRYNGNITYDGMVHIRGSVSDMVKIEATGNVLVEGYVEGASIKAGENIILKSGMNGCGRGVLEAGDKVMGKFFERVKIYAGGDVEGNYFLNCQVETDGSLLARTAKSRIIGGSVKAGYSVETCSIINSGKPTAAIEVGNPVWLATKLQNAEERLNKTEEELRQLTEGKAKVCGMMKTETAEQNALFRKICAAIWIKEEEAQILKDEVCRYERIKERAKRAYVKIFSSIQTGVTVSVCGKIKRIERDLTGNRTFRTAGI